MGILATRRSLLKLGLLLLPMPCGALAQERPRGVVELFTSQGCTSCPPADALLAELAEQDDLVVLSYHVDYWDYLGWKDHLASPENTARQQSYGHVFDSTVYTPQAIVNGQKNIVGSDRAALLAALDDRTPGNAPAVDVSLSFANGSLIIDIAAAARSTGAHIVLVYYHPQKLVEIGGGENKGRTIDYRNIVTSFQTVGVWHGKSMQLELPKSEMIKKGGHCAVLLQSADEAGQPGPILGAARITGVTR